MSTMRLLFTGTVIFLSSFAAAQCEQIVPGPGTQCNGPILIDGPANPTTFFRFTPETSQFACPSGATASFWSFCGRNGELKVDYGSGYVSLKGKDGTNGINGKDGVNGVNGTNGTNGAQGPVGATGAQGVQGPIGAQGATGATGATGPQGIQGVPGLKVGSSGTLILTCQGEAKHSISTGFSTTCTYKVTQ